VADIKLRPYQSEAIAAAKRAYEGGLCPDHLADRGW
jgi:hypothetical protein